MMAAFKNDLEVKRLVRESDAAVQDNCIALNELLESIYGVGSVAKERISKLLDRGKNGTTDSSKL